MALICGTAVLEMSRGLHYSMAIGVESLQDFKLCIWRTQCILIQDIGGRKSFFACKTYTPCMFLMKGSRVIKNISL